jgi:CRP-like cAMP-binding protein
MTGGKAETAAGPRPALIEKLRAYVDLDDEEVRALTHALARTRSIPRGRDIVVQGQPYHALYVLMQGLALRYKILPDGRRQVLNLVVPGDLIGLPACLFEGALASVSGLTGTIVAPIEFAELFELFRRCPRLGVALLWTSAREAGIYIERLVAIGRRSAYERLAHLILELFSRLRAVGLADAASFEMPITQEIIADTLGLSLQHVNRMIRNLREEGLATIEEHRVAIHDMESLVRLAGFEDTYLTRHQIPGLGPMDRLPPGAGAHEQPPPRRGNRSAGA